jgi:hypothetical protein
MSHNHLFLRRMHPELERARKEIWERLLADEDGRKGKRPRSVGQRLGKAKWETEQADLIAASVVGLLGPGNRIWRRNE